MGPDVRHRSRTLEITLALVAALAAGAAGGYLLSNSSGTTSSSNPEPSGGRQDRITALGRLQPAKGVIPVYGPPGDRIATMIRVTPGDVLKEGAEIAVLESKTEREQEVKVATVQVAEATAARDAGKRAGEQKILAAQADLNVARATKDSDLNAIDAKVNYLKLGVQTASAGVKRLEQLRTDGVKIADEDLEKARLVAAQADAELKVTEAVRKKTDISYIEGEKAALAKVEAAKAELAEALERAPIKSTEERLLLAKQLSGRTTIRAPIGGTVLRVIGREGQPTGVEPILQMADLGAMTVIAEVYESDVGRLSEWVKPRAVNAVVENPALGRKLNGVVKSEMDISRMIARNQVFAMGPREDADRRVVEVVVHLLPADAKAAGRFVGLQVTVTLEPNK